NGAALEEGMIVFTPLESPGNTSAGGRIVAGAYQIDADRGPRPGRFKVEIKGVRKPGRKVADTMGGQVDEVEQFLPPRFNRHSELVAQIEDQDRATLDFDLTP